MQRVHPWLGGSGGRAAETETFVGARELLLVAVVRDIP
jgi:hypothetical protein